MDDLAALETISGTLTHCVFNCSFLSSQHASYLEDIPFTNVQNSYGQLDSRPIARQEGSKQALGKSDSVSELFLTLHHLLWDL